MSELLKIRDERLKKQQELEAAKQQEDGTAHFGTSHLNDEGILQDDQTGQLYIIDDRAHFAGARLAAEERLAEEARLAKSEKAEDRAKAEIMIKNDRYSRYGNEPEEETSQNRLPVQAKSDWLELWNPEKSNPPTDASRTLYAIIGGMTSRDNKKILAYLRENYNTPAALIRLREYDFKMAIWAKRRSKNVK